MSSKKFPPMSANECSLFVSELENVITNSENRQMIYDDGGQYVPLLSFVDTKNCSREPIDSDDMLEEIKRIFYRLSEKQDGILISLYDLIDVHSLDPIGFGLSKRDAYEILKKIFAFTCNKANCPISYDPINGVFEKTKSTFDTLKELNHQFALQSKKVSPFYLIKKENHSYNEED